MNEQRLLEALVEDLTPTRPASSWIRALTFWIGLTWTIVGGLVLATGGLRAGAIGRFTGSPSYALEFILGVLTSLAALAAALEWGVPGRPSRSWLLGPGVAAGMAWLALLVYGALTPDPDPSMLGKRVHCSLQSIFFSLPALVLVLAAVSRRALFDRGTTGVLAGVGAAAIPAAWMQLACRYDPMHSLAFHLGPVVLVAGLGALAAWWVLPRY